MKKLSLIALALCSLSAQAETEYVTDEKFALAWEDGEALTHYERSQTHIDLNKTLLISVIASSNAGEQRLYFRLIETKDGNFLDTCSKEQDSQYETWKFNNQNVKMYTYCGEGDGYKYLVSTPDTVKGRAYVVKLFKNSSKDITIEGLDFNLPVSAKGFTKEWNAGGGDSI